MPAQHKVNACVPASLCYNNLSSNGRHFAFAHATEAALCAADGSGKPTLLKDRANSAVTHVRFIKLAGGVELLVVLSGRSAIFFSADGARELHTLHMAEGRPAASFFRGVATVKAGGSSYLYVGSSGSGDLHCCAADPATSKLCNLALATALENVCTGPISDMDGSVEGILAIAAGTDKPDGSSEIILAEIGTDGAPLATMRLTAEAPELCTSLRIRGRTMLAAYSTGRVRVFDVDAKRCVAVVAAHARWINALEVHPGRGIFACASEDGSARP
uniref:Anaphase-promoting complex subunit 4 WD40 domain-containing protein n=2 Tax=Emiliania huxleyi TaxID=2903 RepID=A0A6V2MNQ1_EMIHU